MISTTLGVRPVLWLTLYGVGLVQATDTEVAAFALVIVEVPGTVAGTETWQEDTTVTVTLSKAVRVAARAGLEAGDEASKPKANAQVTYFMDYALFETTEERPQQCHRQFLEGL